MKNQEVLFESKEFFEDLIWANKNYIKLQETFINQWVAIVNKQVVAAGKRLKDVELEAEQKTHKDRRDIPVVFVESGNYVY